MNMDPDDRSSPIKILNAKKVISLNKLRTIWYINVTLSSLGGNPLTLEGNMTI